MNYRRGLGRIGKLLMMWGLLVSIITLLIISIDIWNFISAFISFTDTTLGVLGERAYKAIMKRSREAVVEGLAIGIILAWAPFLLFKLLFWIGDGFTDDDNDN